MGNKESFGGVSEKNGKVRVKGKVNLAVLRNHLGEFRRKRIRLGVKLRKEKSIMRIELLPSWPQFNADSSLLQRQLSRTVLQKF